MVTAYTGPGWENPERKKIFGGSLADVYIHDGFTVAYLVEVSFIDREAGKRTGDIAVYSPADPYRSTPLTWTDDFDSTERFIADYRAKHPDLPTEPVPDAISVPRYKQSSDAHDQIREIRGVLEAREFLKLRGYNVWRMAVLIFVHCQNMSIDQAAIDRARELDAVRADMLNEEGR